MNLPKFALKKLSTIAQAIDFNNGSLQPNNINIYAHDELSPFFSAGDFKGFDQPKLIELMGRAISQTYVP